MSTDTLTPVESAAPTRRVTFPNVVRSERLKFVSVRSNLLTLGGAALTLVVLGGLFAAFAGDPGDRRQALDPVSASFGGLTLVQIVVGVLGALFVANEYANGLIRTMFTAVPRRDAVVAAKALVVGTATWAVMTVAAVATFLLGQALYSGDLATYGLLDDGVLRVVFGSGLYAAGIAVMGAALGFILRSTAGAIATLVGVLMVAPALIGLLPGAVADPISRILPGAAGSSFRELHVAADALSPSAGLLVFAAWIVGLLAVAAWSVRRRGA
ncbi:MAG: ABC transporter permease [Acidimicrobiales bacterium]